MLIGTILLAALILAAAVCLSALLVSRALDRSSGATDDATEVIIETAPSPNGHFLDPGIQLAAVDRLDDPPGPDDEERMA